MILSGFYTKSQYDRQTISSKASSTMAKCQVCGKGPQFGHRVSHSNHKTNRRWNINVQAVSVYSPSGVRTQIRMCTRCLRTRSKSGA